MVLAPPSQPPAHQRQSRFEERLKICVDEIVTRHCDCVICFDSFDDPHITKCGHSFCKNCISEVLNRQHRCPVCNEEQTAADLRRNFTLGELLGSLLREREAEKARYVD